MRNFAFFRLCKYGIYVSTKYRGVILILERDDYSLPRLSVPLAPVVYPSIEIFATMNDGNLTHCNVNLNKRR